MSPAPDHHRFLQIFFCKPPVAGKVKTRLGECLGMDRARDLYAALFQNVTGSFPAEAVRLYSGSDENLDLIEALYDGQPPGGQVRVQHGATLGDRMAHALRETAMDPALDEVLGDDGAILLTGTDIPDYSPEHARQIRAVLDEHDMALGPTTDGGYYCIALRRSKARDPELLRRLFENIPWSTPDVYDLQRQRAAESGLRAGTGPRLSDLDTFDDLVRWRASGGTLLDEFFPDIRVVLPVYNEKPNLEFVLGPILKSGYFREVICADNGSDDGSVELARSLGARVTECARRGYGATCLVALNDIEARGGCEVVLFMDGDGADDPTKMYDLLAPVVSSRYDFSLGQRRPDLAEPGALLPQARFGNQLVSFLTHLLWGFRYHDLGPYRAIRWEALERIGMDDQNFGWTIQMQVRALNELLRIKEIPVPYRRRHGGESKVTATVKGTIMAGYKILYTVGREWLAAFLRGKLPGRRTLRAAQP